MDDELKEMPARVQLILKTIANPKRLSVLRALNAKGSLPYSELKSMVGYRTKNESGKFAYHLRQLRRQALVFPNKNEKQYTITNLGKLILNMVKQVEERSVVDSGQMYVRTSDMSIEEFNADKILQSLVREGRLPTELAQRVTGDVEGRIRKYETNHLSGPLIRELVNTVLLEMGQEEYRNRMTRLGMPAYDVQELLTDNTVAGFDTVAMTIGRNVLNEYLLTNTLPKDVADMHMRGDIHIGDTAGWSLVPDTLFARAPDMLDGAVSWDAQTPRVRPEGGSAPAALAAALERVSWEASGEAVVDGLADATQGMPGDELTRALSFIHHCGADIALRIPLESDAAAGMLAAYRDYALTVEAPRVSVVADPGRDGADRFADELAAMSAAGGMVTVAGGRASSGGVADSSGLDTATKLHSMAINLPRLAYKADRDEKYFRTLLSVRMAPVISALKERRKDIADITRRGLNPFLAAKTKYDEAGSTQLLVNLVGLREAVADVMGFTGEKTHRVCLDTITTAAGAAKRERRAGLSVDVCMIPSGGSARLVELDGREYGKRKIPPAAWGAGYCQGRTVDVREAIILKRSDGMAAEIREMAALLGGGLYTELAYRDDTPKADMAESIRRLAPICGFTLVRRPPTRPAALKPGLS